MEQVAAFATSELNTYQFAWVIAHLAGAYKNSTLNLEVNGPGQAVINELKNLKRQAAAMAGDWSATDGCLRFNVQLHLETQRHNGWNVQLYWLANNYPDQRTHDDLHERLL